MTIDRELIGYSLMDYEFDGIVSYDIPSQPLLDGRHYHSVKSWPHLFQAALEGRKKHDFRQKNERDYKVGDIMILQEYDPAKGKYTGRELTMLITYITSNDTPCALSSSALSRDAIVISFQRYPNLTEL